MFRINKSRQLDRRPLIPSKGHFYVTGYLSSPVSKGQPAEYIYNGNRIRTSTVLQILKASDEFITFETLNSIIYNQLSQSICRESCSLCLEVRQSKNSSVKRRCP